MIKLRPILALAGASARTAMSYRLRFVLSLVSAMITVIPVYFVARALQPMMEKSIRAEGREYFAFLLLGFVVLSLVAVCVDTLPSMVSGDINNGFFEAILGTPAGTPSVLLGLTGYAFVFSLARASFMVALGAILGVHLAWSRMPEASIIVVLLLVAHFGIGLLATAFVIAFRTTLSLPQLLLSASGLLGGVYWPTTVIPSWVQNVSDLLPISYGLRALRRTVLDGLPLTAVSDDVLTLAAYAAFLTAVGVLSIATALAFARKRGTLSQY
jgi:ABC-2 type transport system permease protein